MEASVLPDCPRCLIKKLLAQAHILAKDRATSDSKRRLGVVDTSLTSVNRKLLKARKISQTYQLKLLIMLMKIRIRLQKSNFLRGKFIQQSRKNF